VVLPGLFAIRYIPELIGLGCTGWPVRFFVTSLRHLHRKECEGRARAILPKCCDDCQSIVVVYVRRSLARRLPAIVAVSCLEQCIDL
jgi:hypothetical protein